jgi:predicted lipoprotein with Yx(FWY)xxD motif
MRLWPAGLACAALVVTIGLAVTAFAQSAVKTGKERLGDKASDEQRVDNCKVPPDRRGKTARSASCAHDAKATVTH